MIKSFLKRFLRPISLRTDPEAFSITQFVQWAAKQMHSQERVLDAGAGACRYKKYFAHARYESADFEDVFDKSAKDTHDFVCDLSAIPKEDGSYDAILCTQVLEHVNNPQQVIHEFFRILKPGGKLFLTAPQGWGLHGEPYHFFNFTKYGLEYLFRQSGFEVGFIRARGGIFWYLAKIIKILPAYLLDQYCDESRKSLGCKVLRAILFPVIFTFWRLIPLLLFYFDRYDKRQAWTLGYACYCIKKEVQ